MNKETDHLFNTALDEAYQHKEDTEQIIVDRKNELNEIYNKISDLACFLKVGQELFKKDLKRNVHIKAVVSEISTSKILLQKEMNNGALDKRITVFRPYEWDCIENNLTWEEYAREDFLKKGLSLRNTEMLIHHWFHSKNYLLI